MDYEETLPSNNFIPCVKWVKKGIAKGNPEQVQLTKEELQEIIDHNKEESSAKKEKKKNEEDEYNFDCYDKEGETNTALTINNYTVFSSNDMDPYVTIGDDDDKADSDEDDDIIYPDDNLILVGRVQNDCNILEIYVYNEKRESFYVHHDILLPDFPLCLEWLNYDPTDEKPGNLCAIGTMSPIIEVWDIDVVNSLESTFKLGHKRSKKKNIQKYGHRDAVLSLAWNSNITHVLASGSVDKTVLLWDLEIGKYAMTLSSFKDSVQTLQWQPFEDQILLTGSSDTMVRLFDCHVEEPQKLWKLDGEIECVLWDRFNPHHFLAGTDSGSIHCIDIRNDKLLWELNAHSNEISGMALSSEHPELLVTAGRKGSCKTWDISSKEPKLLNEKIYDLGNLLCLDICPDLPLTVCVGGDNKQNNFSIVDLTQEEVLNDAESEGNESPAMDTDDSIFDENEQS